MFFWWPWVTGFLTFILFIFNLASWFCYDLPVWSIIIVLPFILLNCILFALSNAPLIADWEYRYYGFPHHQAIMRRELKQILIFVALFIFLWAFLGGFLHPVYAAGLSSSEVGDSNCGGCWLTSLRWWCPDPTELGSGSGANIPPAEVMEPLTVAHAQNPSNALHPQQVAHTASWTVGGTVGVAAGTGHYIRHGDLPDAIEYGIERGIQTQQLVLPHMQKAVSDFRSLDAPVPIRVSAPGSVAAPVLAPAETSVVNPAVDPGVGPTWPNNEDEPATPRRSSHSSSSIRSKYGLPEPAPAVVVNSKVAANGILFLTGFTWKVKPWIAAKKLQYTIGKVLKLIVRLGCVGVIISSLLLVFLVVGVSPAFAESSNLAHVLSGSKPSWLTYWSVYLKYLLLEQYYGFLALNLLAPVLFLCLLIYIVKDVKGINGLSIFNITWLSVVCGFIEGDFLRTQTKKLNLFLTKSDFPFLKDVDVVKISDYFEAEFSVWGYGFSFPSFCWVFLKLLTYWSFYCIYKDTIKEKFIAFWQTPLDWLSRNFVKKLIWTLLFLLITFNAHASVIAEEVLVDSWLHLPEDLLINYLIMLVILVIVITALLCVAFFTVAERQVMASIQRRFGPNVSGFFGLLQCFYDGFKLGVKEPILPDSSASGAFSAAPMISFILSQLSFCALFLSDSTFQGLILMALSSLGVYGVMLSGWASNSKYAFLGCLRSVALMVSYELGFGAVLLSISLFLTDSSGMKSLNFADASSYTQFALLPLFFIFLICILAETKRVPFDLPEAEAELVAGFNVEYSALGFALFFIAEYANMAVMAALASVYFLGGFSALKITAIFFGFVWVRATLPRYRYDQFMRLGWKSLLPLSLALYSLYAVFDFVF